MHGVGMFDETVYLVLVYHSKVFEQHETVLFNRVYCVSSWSSNFRYNSQFYADISPPVCGISCHILSLLCLIITWYLNIKSNIPYRVDV